MDRQHPAAWSQYLCGALHELIGLREMQNVEKQHRVTGPCRQPKARRDYVSQMNDDIRGALGCCSGSGAREHLRLKIESYYQATNAPGDRNREGAIPAPTGPGSVSSLQ